MARLRELQRQRQSSVKPGIFYIGSTVRYVVLEKNFHYYHHQVLV
jgi:hypothetical protein